MNDDTHAAEFVAGFLIGALVGAAVALLFAPQPGEETRSLIRERGVELGQRAGELPAVAREKAGELQSQAKEKAGELQSRVKDAVEEGKATAAQKRQELLSQLDQEQSKLDDLEIS